MLEVFTDSPHPLTANEAAEVCVRQHGGRAETHRKRAKELQRLGLIVECGERECRETGYEAMTYGVGQ